MSGTGRQDAHRTLVDFALPSELGNERAAMEKVARAVRALDLPPARLEKLDLNGVTLVGSDWGRAQLLVSEGRAGRVGRLVLVACEAFDNYPAGVPRRAVGLAARVPGSLAFVSQLLKFRVLRRLPGG